MSKRIEYICKPSKRYNEDGVIINDNFYVVMDGATGLYKQTFRPSDACYFVKEFKKRFVNCNDFEKELSNLSKILYSIFIKKYIRKSLKRSHIPSIGLSFVVIDEVNNKAFLYTLGDPVVFVKYKDGSYLYFKEDNLTLLDKYAIDNMINISRKEGISIKEAKKKVSNLIVENRNKLNKDNGYNVFSLYKDGYNFKLSKKEINLDNVSYIALASDGFIQAYDTFKIYDNILDLFDNDLLQTYLKMKYLAYKDKDLNIYPRFKLIDDTTAIKIYL